MESDKVCELCERDVELTFHHLIPKKTHSQSRIKRLHTKEYMQTAGIDICKDCHRMVHRSHTHQLLGVYYYNLKLLKESPKVSKFVKWVKKQTKKAKM